jgi:hypothetical protein
MTSSGFVPTKEHRTRFATGYIRLDDESPPIETPEWDLGSAMYSGGLYSTAEDLARFLILQFQEQPVGGSQILSAGSLRLMRTPQSVYVPYERESYGLGWALYRVADRRVIGHGGGHLGHCARLIADPELKVGIAALTNTYHPWLGTGFNRVIRKVFAVLADTCDVAPEESRFDPTTVNLEQYAGTYSLPGGYASWTIRIRDGKLYASLVEDPDFNEAFLPVGEHEFCFESDPTHTAALGFLEDEEGRINRLQWGSFYFGRVPSDHKR